MKGSPRGVEVGFRTSCDSAPLPGSEPSPDPLASVLSRVASDPRQIRHLHEILGEYCHQCRNQLNAVSICLYLARRGLGPEGGGVWRDVETRYQRVERLIDRLQLLFRPMALTFITFPLGSLIESRKAVWAETLASRSRALVLVPPESPAIGAYDAMRLGAALDDLVAWRARLGDPSRDLRLHWSEAQGWFHLTVDEPPRAESPGGGVTSKRGEPDPPADPSDALVIPLLTRIISLHGGVVETTAPDRWRLDLRWPLHARHPSREAP